MKRLLPSGAGSRSGQIKVGDRLVSCNGVSLRNLTQAKCLSILKSEALNGDLELEVLRQDEHGSPMEISVNGTASIAGINDSQVTLKSPRLDDRHFYPTETESESDNNDVVLSGYRLNTGENIFNQNNVKLTYSSPSDLDRNSFDIKNANLTSDSNYSDFDTEGETSDYSLKSHHLNIIQSKMNSAPFDPNDDWSMVPPPAEFSAPPPPAEFSDENAVTSEVTDSEDNIPATNIDDVLTSYAPSLNRNNCDKNVQNLPVKNLDDKPNKTRHDLSGIPEEHQNETSAHNGLSPSGYMPSSIPGNQSISEQNEIIDVVDSYLVSDEEHDSGHKSQTLNEQDQKQVSRLIESKLSKSPSDQSRGPNPNNHYGNIDSHLENGMPALGASYVIHTNISASKTKVDDDGGEEIIIPNSIKRENAQISNWTMFQTQEENKDDNLNNHVDEECIVPSLIEREKKVAINPPRVDHSPSPPHVSPRARIPSKPMPVPRKSKSRSSDSDESMEECITPLQIKKAEHSKVLEEKFKSDEEQVIVPQVAKKENAFTSGVQLAMLTNKWSNLAKDKPSSEKSMPEKMLGSLKSGMKNNVNENNVTKISVNMDDTNRDGQKIHQPNENNVTKISVNMDSRLPEKLNSNQNRRETSNSIEIESEPKVSVITVNKEESLNSEQPYQTVKNITSIPIVQDVPQNTESEKFIQKIEISGKSVQVSGNIINTNKPSTNGLSPVCSPRDSASDTSIGHVSTSPVTSPRSLSGTGTLSSPSISPRPSMSPRSPVSPKTIPEPELPPPCPPPIEPEIDIQDPTPPKPTLSKTVSAPVKPVASEPSSSQPYRTSVAVSKPSLLSTIRSQNTGQMKSLSSIKPVRIDVKSLSLSKPVKYNTQLTTKPSLLSTLHGSTLSGSKSTRVEEGPFQISVLKGILGLGMKVKVNDEGLAKIVEVQSTGPIAKDGNIR